MALRVTRQYGEVLAAGDGEVRVTRQYAEVLSEGDGKVRVTRQYVAVLAQAFQVLTEDVESNLSLVSTAVRDPISATRSVANTMNLSYDVRPGHSFTVAADNELDLSSVASRVREGDASNTMNLVQTVFKEWIPQDFFPMATVIPFVQQADWESGNYKHLTQTLAFTQTPEWQGPHYIYINTYLTVLDQTADAYKGCPWLPVEIEDEMELTGVANLTYTFSMNNAITMAHEMYRSQTPESTLNLAQTVENGKTKSIPTAELDFEQTINLSSAFLRVLEHPAVIGHALTYYIDTACGNKQYTPFIGESTVNNAPSPPSVDEPIIQSDPTTTRFKLMYPALAAPTDIIELKAPELDNIDRVAFNRISRETRGGKLTVFADPMWPQVQTVIVTFIGLTRTEVDDLLSFFVSHIGEEIGMQDWEGREWVGIVTTPNEAAVQDGKDCTGRGWTITFEFEGVLVDSHTPGDKMTLVDTLDLVMAYHRGVAQDLELGQIATFIKV